jgi:EAL domain-containing protein (putative c-di-GMP-specific phosphodiesterase class I)
VNLAPEIIKLDRALVARIDEDVTRQALVRAGVGFAAALGAALVAEGIETEEELRTLLALGITLGQGFHLGRPEPAEYWARSGT